MPYKDKEKQREYQREWARKKREANPEWNEKIKDYKRSDERKRKRKEQYEEKEKEKNKIWRDNNKERVSAYDRARARRDRAIRKKYHARHKARHRKRCSEYEYFRKAKSDYGEAIEAHLITRLIELETQELKNGKEVKCAELKNRIMGYLIKGEKW